MGYDIPRGFLTLATADGKSADGDTPGPRGMASMVYDSANRRIVLFGGNARHLHRVHNDLWEMPVAQTGKSRVRRISDWGTPAARKQGQSGRRLEDGVGPSAWRWRPVRARGDLPAPRSGAAVVYDPDGKRMVVFGGYAERGTFLNDVWTLNLIPGRERWKPTATGAIGPSPRSNSYCVYNANRGSMILFGGSWGECRCSNDVWELDLESLRWRQVETTDTPSPRFGGGAAFDERTDRIVIFGGMIGTSFTSEVWSLELRGDCGAWRMAQTNQTQTPGSHRRVRGKAGFAVGCDQGHRRCYIFGGWSYPPFRYDNSVSVLDLASLHWEEMGVTGSPPVERRNPAGVFDPANNRLVVFGGDMWPDVFFADTRILQLGGENPAE